MTSVGCGGCHLFGRGTYPHVVGCGDVVSPADGGTASNGSGEHGAGLSIMVIGYRVQTSHYCGPL